MGTQRPFAPAVGDLDHDGRADAVVLERDGTLHAFENFSQPESNVVPRRFDGFPIDVGFAPAAPPVLADIDRDGRLEIVVAGEGRLAAFAYNGVTVSDFPVTIGRRNDPDSAVFTPLAADLGSDLITLITGGESRATLAYRQGREVQDANYPLGGSLSASPAIATGDGELLPAVFVRADDGYLYAFRLPSASGEPSRAVWTMAGRDARNSRTIPDSDLNPIDPDDTFFSAERAYVYPNPAKDEAIVRYWLGADATVSIKIYDIAGNLVTEASGPGTGGAYNEWTWSCADAASGVYYARVEVTAVSGGQSEKIFCKLAVVQ